MTGGDFLVLAPWVLFGAGLAAVSLRLRRRRRGPRRGHGGRSRPGLVTRRGPGRG